MFPSGLEAAGGRVPGALCKPVGLRPGRIWGFFSQFPFSGLWNCALGPQNPTLLWCLAPRGPSTRAALGVRALGISPPRTVTTAVVAWQCAVDNLSPRPRGGLCDRRVPTSAAAWVVPRTPGGLIIVAAASFRSGSQLCPLCSPHPFPNVACGLMPGAHRLWGPPFQAWPRRPKPARSTRARLG